MYFRYRHIYRSGGCLYNGQECGGEMGEREQSGTCTVERRTARDAKVRNKLRCVVCAATWAHVVSAAVLTQRDISGSLALPHMGSVM